MPVITNEDAPRFDLRGTHVVGMASPSRGASETCAWRLTLDPGAGSPDHTLDHEEVFVVIAGKACATLDGRTHELGERDGLIVPAGVAFRIANAADAPFEAIVCLPVGARATVDGEVTVPPWAA
jgi:quercetin dioxygenase-like cupin family protein